MRAAADPGAKLVKYTSRRWRADAADDRLRSNVHPPDWINPEPRGRYHLAVVGGGTAGLVSALGAAGLGARVALVERALLGGDCLITGCVPSKAIVRSARAAADARRADTVGVRVTGVEADFGAVMRRDARTPRRHQPARLASRLRSAGVDVYFGEAHFTSRLDDRGRRPDAAVPARRDRHRRTSRRAADPWPVRRALT